MKLVNKTVWRTDHLKAILQKAAEKELEPAKRKVLHVTVSYTRGGDSSGCAYIRGRHATVRIRHPFSRRSRWVAVPESDPRYSQSNRAGWTKDGVNWKHIHETKATAMTPEHRENLLVHFASVACHEFAHIRGMHHNVMPGYYKWSGQWREYVAWVKGMALEVTAPKATEKPSANDKLAHVLKMKALAETRVKRAMTLLKKWKARERYYEKAAQRPVTTEEEKS